MDFSKIFDIMLKGTIETLYMTLVSTFFAAILGLLLGVLLYITSENNICPSKIFNTILGWIVNIGRSIPFIILMIVLLPLTYLLVRTQVGPNAAIIPLIIGSAPFAARLVESSLSELDFDVVEAIEAMGATKSQLIFKVMIPEAVPSLVRGLSITMITIVGYTAMAGVIGAGGLGDIALRYGVHRYEYGMMIATLILIVIIVQIIQVVFNLIVKNID